MKQLDEATGGGAVQEHVLSWHPIGTSRLLVPLRKYELADLSVSENVSDDLDPASWPRFVTDYGGAAGLHILESLGVTFIVDVFGHDPPSA
jgi:hypothetical protein